MSKQDSKLEVEQDIFTWASYKHSKDIQFREEDKKELMELINFEGSDLAGDDKFSVDIKVGDLIECSVIAITDKNVIVNTGFKSEGVIPIQEFIESGSSNVQIGDKYELYVIKLENDKGSIILSRKTATAKRHWDDLCKAVGDENAIVTGLIFRKTSGGFRVNLGHGIEGFLPNCQTGISPVEEFEKMYFGKECEFKVLNIGTNLILSTRSIVALAKEGRRKEIFEVLTPGTIVEGIVKNVTQFGVFVNIDNAVDGLVRLPDISYKRVKSPAEVDIVEGKKIKVVVLSNEDGRLSFGVKQLQSSPWEGIEERYPVGSKVSGKAVNILHYGVFVEIVPGVEGLVHFSEMCITQPITSLHEVISLGDVVEATVIYVNAKSGKFSLSMIRESENEVDWQKVEDKYDVGTTHKAVVKSLLKHCAIVELEPGVTSQVHIPDISKETFNHSSALLSIGEEVNVRVLRISKSYGTDTSAPRKIISGIRQYNMENWEDELVKEGAEVQARISRITPFGAIALIGNGQRGYIHLSEMSKNTRNKAKVEDFVAVGDVVSAVITNIDSHQNMITLSLANKEDEDKDSNIESGA